MDYGFHADDDVVPRSKHADDRADGVEDLGELDRFVEAMIAIRRSRVRQQGGPPTTTRCTTHRTPPTTSRPTRGRALPRHRGVPVARLRHDKYWPPVGRIDGVYGDRNVVQLPSPSPGTVDFAP
jgi:glycine dehydrogenase